MVRGMRVGGLPSAVCQGAIATSRQELAGDLSQGGGGGSEGDERRVRCGPPTIQGELRA
jgi:hypothetical protein